MTIARLLWGSALALALGTPALAQEAEKAGARTLDDPEAIIVTATRREQTLQEVPISVAVVGGGQIEKQGILLFDAVQDRVPNLQSDRSEEQTPELQPRM